MVPTTCTGPEVKLSFVPKTCVLDDAAKQVVCDPAKLVLTKTPGSCTHKYPTQLGMRTTTLVPARPPLAHHSPARSPVHLQECKIGTECGFSKALVHGGSEYSIPLKQFSMDYQP